MRYIILALLLPLAFSQGDDLYGRWFYPTQTPIVQSDSTAMTFGLSEGDLGKVYVLFSRGRFKAYNHVSNQWADLASLPTNNMRGSAICPWHNQGSEEFMIFAIPYDIKDVAGAPDTIGSIYEYDILSDTWKKLDTVPHYPFYTLGKGLSLKTGDCYIHVYINIYWLGGMISVGGGQYQNEGFYVYRRVIGASVPRGPEPVTNYWVKLAKWYHGDGADIAYYPDNENPRVYGTRGEDSRIFGVYKINTDVWDDLTIPDPPHDIKEGGSLAADGVLGAERMLAANDDYIYAFEGGGSDNFQAYTPDVGWNYNSNFPHDPDYDVHQGADLAFGYWKDGAVLRKGIWATFGGRLSQVGFFDPSLDEEQTEGGQSTVLEHFKEPIQITQVSRDQISLKFPEILQSNARLKIFDVSGRIAYDFSMPKGKKEYRLNWLDAPTGIYYYRLKIDNEETSGKLVKM